MKKTIYIFFAMICAAVISKAQTIPNNGFENWTSMGSYDNPDSWGTMNNTTATSGIFTAVKGIPGNPGNYYHQLTSTTVGASVVNGIAVCGKLDSISLQPISGMAFTLRPLNFTGKWQHMIYGSSQGSVSVKLTRWDSGLNQRITVASANRTLSGMVMSWASFTIPFVYSDGMFPDTCMIVLKASGTSPAEYDYLFVDNLAFTGSNVGIENNEIQLNNISVFPNPSNNLLQVGI